MSEEIITDEMKKAIGARSKPLIVDIEKGMLRKFAEAIEDPNPLWQDEEYANKARYGGIIAPPGLIMASIMTAHTIDFPFQFPMPRLLDGGGEWEYLKPIRPGDVITVEHWIADIREREGKMGKMIFIIGETTWTNQKNELVARGRGTLINY